MNESAAKKYNYTQLTWRLVTAWNRTYLRGIGFPSFTCSSVSSITCAASGSTASSTSSNPRAGLLMNSFIVLGAWSGFMALLILIDRTRTDWLNWHRKFQKVGAIEAPLSLRLTAMLSNSCSSTSLSRYVDSDWLRTFEASKFLSVCCAPSFRQLTWGESRNCSSDCYGRGNISLQIVTIKPKTV